MEAEEYVPLPKGDVHKKKEIVQDVTLHDLDVANARPQVFAADSVLNHSSFQGHFKMNSSYLISGRAGHPFNDGTTDEA